MSVLVIVFITAILVLFSGVYRQGKWTSWLGILGLSLALGMSFLPENPFWDRYQNMFIFSDISLIFTRISLLVSIFIFLLGDFALYRHQNHQSEIYALMLFSLCGGLVLFGFQNVIMLFLGIEILSIPLYVLAGSDKNDVQSIEASVKYFLIGAFATGFLLLGFAFVYGALGTFQWGEIQDLVLEKGDDILLKIGSLLILGALGFKVAMVPFHFWSPDVYQGSPSIITLFMATIVKIAGFFAFFEVFRILPIHSDIFAFLTIISLILPSVLGLIQTDVKRLLAYSSIVNVGYLMLIFFGINEQSHHILSFYLWAYALANVGVFLGLIFVEKNFQNTDLESFNGLAKSHPFLAVMMSVSLFSLAGIPFTAGFIGKLNLFLQAFAEVPLLVILAVIASVVSMVYYLKLIVAMFFRPIYCRIEQSVSLSYIIVSLFIIFSLIILGIYPYILVE